MYTDVRYDGMHLTKIKSEKNLFEKVDLGSFHRVSNACVAHRGYRCQNIGRAVMSGCHSMESVDTGMVVFWSVSSIVSKVGTKKKGSGWLPLYILCENI